MWQSEEIWYKFEVQKVIDLVAVHVLELDDDYLRWGCLTLSWKELLVGGMPSSCNLKIQNY